MASNPFNDVILRSMANSAQANAAKSGQGGFGTVLAQALGAAFSDSPLFRGIAAGNQAYNVGQYNKTMAENARQTANYERMIKANEVADNAGIGRQAGLTNYSGYGKLPDAATLGLIQDQNQNPAMNDFLGGGPLHIAAGGRVTPDLIKQYMERLGKNADSQTTMGLLDRFMGPNAFGSKEGAKVESPGGTAQMDTTGPLTAGIQASNLFDQNPFGIGIPDLAQLGILRKNEQDDRLGNRKATETERSNKADEADNAAQTAINRAIYNATKNNQGGYGRNAPQPHSPTEADRAWQMYQSGQMSRDEYVRTMGGMESGGGTSGKNDPVLKGLQANLQATAKKYGSQSAKTLEAASRVESYKAGQALKSTPMPSVSQLFPNMSSPLFGGGSPFGGQARQNLQQGAQNLSKSIYPGRG